MVAGMTIRAGRSATASRRRWAPSQTSARCCVRDSSSWNNKGDETMKVYALAIVALLALPALAQQRVPELKFTSVPDYPTLPDGMNFGEVPGVAVNSRGHVFVFSRSNSATGPAFGAAAAQLFEFDQNGEFV